MRVPIVCICLALIASGAPAAESWRSAPLDSYTVAYSDGQTRLTVDWGTQGPTLDRRPEEVRDEFARFNAWLRSPEVLGPLLTEQAKQEVRERDLGAAQAATMTRRYETEAQPPGLPAQAAPTERRIPMPAWLHGVPADVRPLIQVALFDAGEADQVAWAISIRKAHPELHLFALGWSSLKALDQLNLAHPYLSTLAITAVPGGRSPVDFASDYGVQALPAFVCLDAVTSELVIAEGGGR